MDEKNCIFCKIIKGVVPSSKVYEDEKIFAFLDIRPINKGHTLVIPKKHYETALDMPKKEFEELYGKVHSIARAISSAFAPDGFNIFCNNKPVAGQEVPHFHIHIAPRYKNDGNRIKWKQIPYPPGEIEKSMVLIKKFL